MSLTYNSSANLVIPTGIDVFSSQKTSPRNKTSNGSLNRKTVRGKTKLPRGRFCRGFRAACFWRCGTSAGNTDWGGWRRSDAAAGAGWRTSRSGRRFGPPRWRPRNLERTASSEEIVSQRQHSTAPVSSDKSTYRRRRSTCTTARRAGSTKAVPPWWVPRPVRRLSDWRRTKSRSDNRWRRRAESERAASVRRIPARNWRKNLPGDQKGPPFGESTAR